MRKIALTLSLTTSIVFAGLQSDLVFQTAPKKIKTGSIALLKIMTTGAATVLPTDMFIKVGDAQIPTFECPNAAPLRCALVPVSVDTKPGLVEITANWTVNGDKQTRATFLNVAQEHFAETQLTVDPSRANPSPEELKRMDLEKDELNAAYAKGNPLPLWTDKFTMPAKGRVTSRFGGRRIFNGELKSVHYGTDISAGTGTPIYAPNSGVVIMAKEFFLGGNMVIIDHGAGMFSSYGHLSKFAVEVGAKVKKGQLIGKAGATGRVTGPHLHWAMRVGGVNVDPVRARETFNRLYEKQTFGHLPSSRQTRFKPFKDATR